MDRYEQRIHSRREFLKDLTYEIFKPSWRNENFDARILDISRGGACVLAEGVHEPGIVLNLSPHPRGMRADIQVPSLAQVRWISPVLERPRKARFRIGLQFITKSLYEAIIGQTPTPGTD
jgi:hypothetical protein